MTACSQLRLLQTFAQSPGNTLVLSMSGDAIPIPLRETKRPVVPETTCTGFGVLALTLLAASPQSWAATWAQLCNVQPQPARPDVDFGV